MGWFKPVHVKTAQAQKLRALVVARKGLVRKLADTEQLVRGLSRLFGLKVGPVVRRRFAERGRELVAGKPVLVQVAGALLEARHVLVEQVRELQRLVLAVVRRDPACRRLTGMPGVGPVIALTFRVSIDQPHRFRRSRSVGAYFGLTPRRYQSGEVDRTGRISKAGDAEARGLARGHRRVIMRPSTRWSALKAWTAQVAKRQGSKKAKVALARKIAGVLHRMWVDGTEFRWSTAA
jgi:transposase